MPHCTHSGFCNAEVAQQFVTLAEKVVSSLPVGMYPELRTMAYDALEAFEKADHDQAPDRPTLATIDTKLDEVIKGLAGLYR